MGRDKKVLSGPGRRDHPDPREAADEAGRQPRRQRQRRATPTPYVELHGASAFSFLRGASLPAGGEGGDAGGGSGGRAWGVWGSPVLPGGAADRGAGAGGSGSGAVAGGLLCLGGGDARVA